MHIDGQCHCGHIRYEATIDPERVLICHCTDCQRLTGSPFRLTALCDGTAVKRTGDAPAIYVKTGGSGAKRNMYFCGGCGTPMFSSSADGAGEWGIRWGSINQRAALIPKRQIWIGSAVAWLCDVTGLPDGGVRSRPVAHFQSKLT